LVGLQVGSCQIYYLDGLVANWYVLHLSASLEFLCLSTALQTNRPSMFLKSFPSKKKYLMLPSLLLATFIAAKDPEYGRCDLKTFAQSANVNKSYPIKPALVQSPIVISGDFYIIDGCTFGLRNLIFYNAQVSPIVS
jgi:hypothetical protein